MNAHRVLAWLALALGAWFLAWFVGGMLWRAAYPYELEWLEGAMLVLVERVRAGESLYAEPTLEYTMHVYAPLYYWLAAGLSAILGDGPVAPRLVSIAASIGTLAVIWRWVERNGGGRAAAFLAACLYAATFDAGKGYQDAVRVDALFVLLLTLGLYGLQFWRGLRGAAVAGGIVGLSFVAKQASLLVPVPMFLLLCWVRGVREAAVFLVAAALPIVIELLALDAATDGWSSWFLIGQLGGHEIDWQMVRGFWTHDIAKVVGIACVVAVWQVAVLLRSRQRDAVLLACSTGGMIGIAYVSRLHSGGAENVVYPAWVAIAVLAGIALGRAARGPRPALVLAVWVVQLAVLAWRSEPWHLMPSAADRAGGDRLVAELAALDRPALVHYHGWLASRVGKQHGGHPVAIEDVLRSGDAPIVEAFREQARGRLAGHHYRWIVLDDTVNSPWLEATIREHYRPVRSLLGDARYRWLNNRAAFDIVLFEPK